MVGIGSFGVAGGEEEVSCSRGVANDFLRPLSVQATQPGMSSRRLVMSEVQGADPDVTALHHEEECVPSGL